MKKRFLVAVIYFAIIVSVLCMLTSCAEKEFEGLSFSDGTFVYDGFEHSISLSGAPEEAEITYFPSNIQSDEGSYFITATVSLENYRTKVLTATLKIVYPEDYALDSDIEALIARLNAAIGEADSANDAKINALKNEYQSKLDALSASAASLQAALDALKTEYLAKVGELERKDTENNSALLELTASYEEELIRLKASDSENKAKIDALTAEYNEKITELEGALQGNQEALDALKEDYEEELARLKACDAENEDKIDALTAEYNGKVTELEGALGENEEALDALKEEYEEELARLKACDAENEDKIDALTAEYNGKVTELEGALEENEEALDALKEDYEKELENLKACDTENEAKIDTLTAAYNKKAAELQTAINNNVSALDVLRSNYEASVIELNSSITQNKTKINAVKVELQTNIDKLTRIHNSETAAITSLITALQSANAGNAEKISELEAKVDTLLAAQNHTVSFDLGGAVGTVAPQTVKHGEKASKPANPTREGYSFVGWYAGDEKWSFIGYTVTESITLTAKWANNDILSLADGYTLEDGRVTSTQRYTRDYIDIFSVITIDRLSTATLYKDSALTEAFMYGRMSGLCAGVNKAYLVIENEYAPTSIYEIVITLTKTSDFYSDGAIFKTVVVEDDKIEAPTAIPVSQNPGYEFDFWAVDGVKASFPYDFSVDVKFEAVYKPTVYTVTYNPNGGTMPDNYTTEYTVESGISLPLPTRSLYIFDGWYADEDLSGEKVTEIAYGDITLYAKWKSATGGIQLTLSESSEYYIVTGYSGTDKAVVIPESVDSIPVTSIGSYAFYNSNGITSVTIPKSVTKIDDTAFLGCSSLNAITVTGENADYQSIDGNLYTKDGSVLLQYAIGKTDEIFLIPESVKLIGKNAFAYCTALSAISIGSSVEDIGDRAFSNCTSLTDIYYTGSEQEWSAISKGENWDSNTGSYTVTCNSPEGDGAVSGTAGIEYEISADGTYATVIGYTGTEKNVVIPDTYEGATVTGIGFSAFYECRNLKSITIPNSVTRIGNNALSYCSGLSKINYCGTQAEWDAIPKGAGWNDGLSDFTVIYNYGK